MRGNDSSAAARDRWFTVSLTSYRPESPVWTWLAVAGLLAAIVLAIVGMPPIVILGLCTTPASWTHLWCDAIARIPLSRR